VGLLRNNGVVKIVAAVHPSTSDVDAPSQRTPAPVAHEPLHDVAGRDRVAASLLNEGPATASLLATRLGISATAVRRHLDNLVVHGWVQATERPPYGPSPTRGRGRPARTFALTAVGRSQFPAEYDALAVDALAFVEQVGGVDAVAAFAESRGAALEVRLRAILGNDWQSASDIEQVRAFAAALGELGFATSVDPAPAGVQVCQHHCPVAHVAGQYPQLCEAETEAFARLLGRHVQRLATIANGDGVCTTVIPVSTSASPMDRPTTERTSA
jgi:predicted ArsR family transcriptional regulator